MTLASKKCLHFYPRCKKYLYCNYHCPFMLCLKGEVLAMFLLPM